MALYSGFSQRIADLISTIGISKTDIIKIINKYPQHKIGELKFITNFSFKPNAIPGLKLQNNIWQKDPATKDDFRGWVYPNGAEFLCKDFPEAAAVYAKSSSDLSFKIPDLTNMFFAGYQNGYDKHDPSTMIVDMKNDIPFKHMHSVTNDQSADIILPIQNGFVICVSKSAGTVAAKHRYKTGQGKSYDVPVVHAGDGNYRYRVPFPMNIKVKIGDLAQMFSDGSTENAKSITGDYFLTNPVFSPSNRLQPVMIYIGSAKNSEYREEFTVVFYDWDGSVLSQQSVIKGNSAVPPVNPSRSNYTFKEWDKPFDNINSDTEITAVYQPKTYVIKSYTNNIAYGNVTPESYTVSYGQSAEFTANPASGKMLSCWIKNGSFEEYDINSTHYTVYPNDLNIDHDNQLSVTAVFIDQPEHIGWSLRWDLEYNCDAYDQRTHFASNIANYVYKNQLISADNSGNTELVEKYVYTVASDTVSYPYIPANNREYLTLEKLYGRKIGDKYEVTLREDYGRFLLCTKKKDSTGLSASADDFHGYAFDTGSVLNVSNFVTPVGNIVINGWQDFPDAEGVVLSSVNFTNVRDPEMYPVPQSVFNNNPIYLNVRTVGDDIVESFGQKVFPSDVSCATKAQYTAFWGSENPVFITDAQILEN